jgi:hypothetical protein
LLNWVGIKFASNRDHPFFQIMVRIIAHLVPEREAGVVERGDDLLKTFAGMSLLVGHAEPAQ